MRQAVEKIIELIAGVTKHVVLVGHIKEKSIVSAQGIEVGSVKDLDMTGKLGRILAAKSDAIGFVYRDKENNLCLNFENDGEVSVGARPAHLANKRIVVAERQDDGTFINHWGRIYPSLNND